MSECDQARLKSAIHVSFSLSSSLFSASFDSLTPPLPPSITTPARLLEDKSRLWRGGGGGSRLRLMF